MTNRPELASARTTKPPSARPLQSARTTKPPSAHPLQSAIFKKTATKIHTPLTPSEIFIFKHLDDAYTNPENWHTQSSKNDLKYYIHNKTKIAVTPSEYIQIADIEQGGGGSRRRRTSHRKRKSYRKSKCVRHTRRKQTRRHRHRRSRHRR